LSPGWFFTNRTNAQIGCWCEGFKGQGVREMNTNNGVNTVPGMYGPTYEETQAMMAQQN